VLAPFLPMLTALTVAAIQIELGHRLDRAAWSMAFTLVGFVLVRQALLVVDLLASGKREAKVSERLVDASGSLSGYVKEWAGERRSQWSCPGPAAIGSI
jgi:hypothetical protein